MNSYIGSTTRSFTRRLRFHRPYLERLEQRLPPGDTLALLLGGAAGLSFPNSGSGTHAVQSSFPNSGSGTHAVQSSFPNSGSGTYFRETPFRVGEASETEFRVLNVPKQEFGNEDNADSNGTAATYPGIRDEADLDWLGNDSARTQRIVSNPESPKRPLFMDAGSPVSAPGAGRPISVSSVPTGVAGRAPIQAAFNAEPPAMPAEQPADVTGEQQSQVKENYGRLPISFEANHGQVDDQVDFIARGSGYQMFLTPTEAVVVLEKNSESRIQNSESIPDWRAGGVNPLEHGSFQGVDTPRSPPAVVRMQFVGANPNPEATGQEQLPGIVSYFIGNDPSKWRTDIPTFAKVEYDEVYPGIDLVYHSAKGQLEYDFVVAPGADPRAITLNFAGADKLEVNAGGDLIVHAGGVELRQHKPVLYQETDGGRQEVAGSFDIDGQRVVFDVGVYDVNRPLVIDPVMAYSKTLGGNAADFPEGIAFDSSGNAVVAGQTHSTDFPTVGAIQGNQPDSDGFVFKFNASGTLLLYSTYLGGDMAEMPWDVAVDRSGNAFVVGFTQSTNFPTAGTPFQGTHKGQADGFISKLNSTGSMLDYSSFIGGTSTEECFSVAVDAVGNAYLSGRTGSADFPKANAFDATFNGQEDVFVSKVNATGSVLVYSTYLGGSSAELGYGIAVDGSGSAYVTGSTASPEFPSVHSLQSFLGNDAFVTKLSSTGSTLEYSTFLGGSSGEIGTAIAVDGGGHAYVTGYTFSSNFPTTNAFQSTNAGGGDAYVTKLNWSASTQTLSKSYSTYLGGSGSETTAHPDIAVSMCGEANVTGTTDSTNFPTQNAIQGSKGGSRDAFVTTFNGSGNALVQSTYLSGNSFDDRPAIGADNLGQLYVSMLTWTNNSTNAEVMTVKIVPGNPPPISTTAWTAKGPAPINNGQTPGNMPVSGRIAAIAPHPSDPDIIYIGAAGGGVWKTIDAGATWTPLTDELPLVDAGKRTLFMGALALAPSDPNVIYAGTGEATNSGASYYGRGILKSTDAGATWQLFGNTEFDRKAIARIVVHPLDPNTVYVAVANAANGGIGNTGIWRSTDGGVTWANKTTAITVFASYSDLVMHPLNPNLLYAAVGQFGGDASNGLWRSRNGGQTWTALGNFPNGVGNGRITLAQARSTPNVMYAAVADPATYTLKKFLKTTTSGRIWNEVPGVPNYLGTQGFYDSALIVDPANEDIVYAGGQQDIIQSPDGGDSWDFINFDVSFNGPHADHQAFAFDANADLLDANDGGIWRLDRGGAFHLWEDLNTNLQITQFIGIGTHPTDANIAYGGAQDNGTSKTTGAQAWNQVRGGDGGFVRVDCANPNTIYHTFYYLEGAATGFFERSDDGGANWSVKTDGLDLDNMGNFYIPYVIDPMNTNRLLLGTNHVYETTDKAETWTDISFTFPANIDSLESAATDVDTIYMTAGGHIYKTINHGVSWPLRDIPGATDHFSDLLVDPNNSKIVYAARDRFNNGSHTGHVFQSIDGGLSWTDITADLGDIPVNALALDPRTTPSTPAKLYVGTDQGVYSADPEAPTWTRVGNNLPYVMVRELTINLDLNILSAGTHGRGMWAIGLNTPAPLPPAPPPDDDPPLPDVPRPRPAQPIIVVADLELTFRPVRPSETPAWRNADVVITGSTVTLSKPIRSGAVTRKTVGTTTQVHDLDFLGTTNLTVSI